MEHINEMLAHDGNTIYGIVIGKNSSSVGYELIGEWRNNNFEPYRHGSKLPYLQYGQISNITKVLKERFN